MPRRPGSVFFTLPPLNPVPRFSPHRFWVIEPPPPPPPPGGAGRPGVPGSGPGTAALRTPSPARHLPLPHPVASHPWPCSRTAPGSALVQGLRGCVGKGPHLRGPLPQHPLGTPRLASSTFRLGLHTTSLYVFRPLGSRLASVSPPPQLTWGQGRLWREGLRGLQAVKCRALGGGSRQSLSALGSTVWGARGCQSLLGFPLFMALGCPSFTGSFSLAPSGSWPPTGKVRAGAKGVLGLSYP